MKKLLILALVLVVAGGLFAQVTVSGQVKYGFMTYFGPTYPGQYWDSQVITTAKLDDFTSAVIRLAYSDYATNGNEYAGWTGAPSGTDRSGQGADSLTKLTFSRAYVQSELLGAMGVKGLPVTNTLIMGMNYWATDLNSGVDAAAISDMTEQGVGTAFTIVNRIGIMNMAYVTLAAVPGYWAKNGGGWVIDALVMVAPVQVNLNYKEAYSVADPTKGYNDIGKGDLGFGAKFSQAFKPIMLDAYAAMKYSLWSSQIQWGLASKVGFETLAFAQVGLYGYSKMKDKKDDFQLAGGYRSEDSWLNRVSLRAAVTPVSILTLDVGTVLNLEPKKNYVGTDAADGNMLNELIVGAWLNVAKTATFHFGYLMLGDSAYFSSIASEQGWIGIRSGAGGFNSKIEKGGFFVETKLTF